MTHRFLKTTTAIALVLGLANPLAAQDLDALTGQLSGLEPAAALELLLETRAVAEAAGNTDAIAEIDALIAEYEAAGSAEPAENAAPVDASEPAAPEASAPAEPETAAAPEAPAEPETAAAPEAPAEPEAPAAPEAVDAAPEDAPAEAADVPQTPGTDGEAAAEADAETQALEQVLEAEQAAEPEQTAEPAQAAEPEQAAEPAQAAEPEQTNEASADAPAEEAPTEEAATEDAPTEEAATEETPAETVAPDAQAEADAIAADDAAASVSAAAAAASGEGNAEPEVVEETVTEETARSSSEEFETDIGSGTEAAQAAQTEQARDKDDDDDTEDRDRALRGAGAALLGLGALALNDILRPNEQVYSDTGDRVVVERDGQYRVLRNDDALLRQPGSNVTTYRFDDGSTRSVVVREDGSEIETIRARDGRVLRRTRTLLSGETVLLFDDTQTSAEVDVNTLPQTTDRRTTNFRDVSDDDLARALARADGEAEQIGRSFSLNQIRNIDPVRKLVPEINVDTVNFETGSAVIRPEEAEELSALGRAIRNAIADNPGEVFLIEGHTDAVGNAGYNLALSDRRAESVALALTEYFDVPPENMVIQGYGESDLLIATSEGERANRRAAVRRITPLLAQAQN